MSRLQVGIVEAASGAGGGGGGPPALDPENIETAWTGVGVPAGWTNTVGAPIYTATGVYQNTNDGDSSVFARDFIRPLSAYTVILGYTINSYDNGHIISNTEDDVCGLRSNFSTDTTPDAYHYLPIQTCSFVSELLLPSGPTGFVVSAGTLFQDGTRTVYRLDPGGSVTASTPLVGAPYEGDTLNISVSMDNYDFNLDVPGTPGEHRLKFSYFGFDEELDQAAIEAIATGWGWA